MSLGSVQTVLVCDALPGAESTGPCGEGYVLHLKNAYVLSETSQSTIEGLAQPLDYTELSQVFGISFIATMSFYFAVKMIGVVIKFISQNTR